MYVCTASIMFMLNTFVCMYSDITSDGDFGLKWDDGLVHVEIFFCTVLACVLVFLPSSDETSV